MAHAPYEHISSTANPTIKLLKSLDRKKVRNDSGLFLAEGARIIQDALKFGWRPEYVLIGSEDSQRAVARDLARIAQSKGAKVLTVSTKVLSAVSRKDNAQTIIAAFHQDSASLEDLENKSGRRITALYEVRDPGNLGTILRTADAAGVDAVILINQCCDPFSVECVRATMGALFSVKFISTDFVTFNSWRKSQGFQMIAASVNGKSRHDNTTYREDTVVLMGNEQSGIPDNVEAQCDTLVKIPMAGAADSLNLAQATAIMTYEVWKSTGYKGAR